MTDRRLQTLHALGPYFVLGTGEGPGRVTVEAWLADPDRLGARVAATRAALARAAGGQSGPDDVETRVAASVVHLGWAARLVSPFLALACLHEPVEVPTLAQLFTSDAASGAVPLHLPDGLPDAGPPPMPSGPPEPSMPSMPSMPTALPDVRWAAALVDRLLLPLDRAFAASCPSPRTRAGNAASAVNGAALVMIAHLARSADPLPAARVRSACALLRAQPYLAAAATGVPGTATFRRRSCCWLYRATARSSPRVVCDDCVLVGARGPG